MYIEYIYIDVIQRYTERNMKYVKTGILRAE